MTTSTTSSGLRVLISGAGVGGLALAHGLRAAGVDVRVFERDSSVIARDQGYRLHISPEGEQALRACVPARVADFISATSNTRYGEGLFSFDELLTPGWAPTFGDSRGDRPDKIDSVDRLTFRRALLSGLEDVVRFDSRVESFEALPDSVVVHLADGRTETGDVLIAADGSRSRVRDGIAHAPVPVDLGARTIFGRVPMNETVQTALSAELANRFSYILGSQGCHLGLMPMAFRNPATVAAARYLPEVATIDREDYYMCVLNMHADSVGVPDETLFALSGEELWQLVRSRTANWHPRLRTVIDQAVTHESFVLARRATQPVQSWSADRVVGLGDAIHTMPPSGGVGANTALRDAAALVNGLTAVARGTAMLGSMIRDYQQNMVEYASEALALSLRIAQWSTPAATILDSVGTS